MFSRRSFQPTLEQMPFRIVPSALAATALVGFCECCDHRRGYGDAPDRHLFAHDSGTGDRDPVGYGSLLGFSPPHRS